MYQIFIAVSHVLYFFLICTFLCNNALSQCELGDRISKYIALCPITKHRQEYVAYWRLGVTTKYTFFHFYILHSVNVLIYMLAMHLNCLKHICILHMGAFECKTV